MSGFADYPGDQVRARVRHPIIDSDAHIIECEFVLNDYVKEIGGAELMERSRQRGRKGPAFSDNATKGLWWGAPSGRNTSDRAMAMLPRYFRSQMDRAGLDFAHMLTTNGIGGLYIPDDELRQVRCRALNTMYADMFKDVGDRIRPVAVIPTYTPEEAVRELDHAVLELGHKAVMIGTEIRTPHPGVAAAAPELAAHAQKVTSIAMDSPHDYDPFWRRCVELGVAPLCHTSAHGARTRNSPTNYVFNHLGSFASGSEYFCRSLFLGGVTNRFPTLKFGFLECGAGWALTLLNDIVEHWEKRNVRYLQSSLDPDKLDIALMAELFEKFGDARHTAERFLQNPHHGLARPGRPELFDEFGAAGMTEVRDLRRLFCDNFYFGCEADDRMLSVAFNRRLNPVGTTLKAMFGSDIGHWDVMDARSILSEAYNLIQAELITEDDFKALTFDNCAEMMLSMNPGYFDGTVIQDAAHAFLRERSPAAA